MVTNKMMKVEVVYINEHTQELIALNVIEGATIESVIEQSGIMSAFPEIDLTRQSVGIFSRQRLLTDTVKAGDRIEIYRPLVMDPKDARRAKALKKD